MQTVHANNVEAHKFLRANKGPVKLDEVKDGSYTTDPVVCHKIGEVSSVSQRPMSQFYTDQGPQEEWDYLFNRHAYKLNKNMVRGKDQRGSTSRTVGSLTQMVPAQSLLTQNRNNAMMANAMGKSQGISGFLTEEDLHESGTVFDATKGDLIHRRESVHASHHKSMTSMHSAPAPQPKHRPVTPTGSLPPNASYVEHLKSMKRDNIEEDDEVGPYDFRRLLKKTGMASGTETLRQRRTDIPIITMTSPPSDSRRPSILPPISKPNVIQQTYQPRDYGQMQQAYQPRNYGQLVESQPRWDPSRPALQNVDNRPYQPDHIFDKMQTEGQEVDL